MPSLPGDVDRNTRTAAEHETDHEALHATYNTLMDEAAAAGLVLTKGTSGAISWGPARFGVHLPPATAHAKDDEFTSGTLDAKWTLRNLVSGNIDTVNTADGMLLDATSLNGGSQPTGTFGLEQAFAPAGDFTIVARMGVSWMSERQMLGLYVVESDGDGISVCVDNGDSAAMRTLTAYAQVGPTYLPYSPDFTSGRMLRFGLRRVGTNYRGFIQSDDVILPTRVRYATYTPGGTVIPAKLGIGRVYGNGASQISVDYLRVSEP